MKVKIIAVFIAICFSVNGETFYKTSFEPENEPFGAVTKTNTGFAVSAKAAVSTEISHSGKYSITPGPGSGRYGKFCTKTFSPLLNNKELWVQYYFYTPSISYSGYKSFLILKGPAKSSKGIFKATSILFYSKNLVASGKRFKLKLNSGWNKVKVKLDMAKQSYDLYINDTFATKEIPFAALAKSKTLVKGISTIIIGGGASKIHLSYLDDFYIGSKNPDLQNALQVTSNTQSKLHAKGFITINKSFLPPIVDGKDDDKCWQESSTFSPFLTINGELAKIQQTRASITYDDKNLYVLFKCFDTQLNPVLNQLAEIKANASSRDSNVFKDDSVELFIAPNTNIPSQYYHFAINTKGIIYDAKLPNPGSSWNSKISTGIKFDDKKWVIEVKIPFKEIGIATPPDNTEWNINLCRNKPSLSELSCWNPTYSSFHSYNNWGRIRFSSKQPVISCELPEVIKEGSNSSIFHIRNFLPKSYIVENRVDYQNSDCVTTAQIFNLKSEKSSVKDELIVYTGNDLRSDSRSCITSYKIKDKKTDKLLYSIPGIKYPLVQYSPFKTNFIAESSRIFYVCFNNMYIANKSSLHRMLLIQYAKDISGKFKECEFIIDMPECISIINPSGSGKKNKPLAVKEIMTVDKGEKRRKYVFTFPARLTYSQKKIGRTNPYNEAISFVFYCASDNTSKQINTINYYTRAKIDGKMLSEAVNKIPLTILPEVKGKMPKKLLLISSFGNYNMSISLLSDEEAKKCIANIANSGFNVFSYCDWNRLPFNNRILKNLRSFGLKIEKAFFAADKSWLGEIFPSSREYLKKYPQYRAVNGKGKAIDHVISIAHLIDPKSKFRSIMKQRLSSMAKELDIILWDHEARQLGEKSLCYNKQSLIDFKKYLKLDHSLTIKQIQNDYKKQWVEFQCIRNARLGKIMRDIVKQANPQCQFNLYSGYQSKLHETLYGVDWKLFGKFIDNAECGYRRPLAELEATSKAVAPNRLIPGELILCWSGNLKYDFSKLKINLLRRLTDGNGGFLVFYDLQVDGRFWNTVGEISRLVADYESFFIKCEKNKKAVKIISGIDSKDLVVYENDSLEKLIILFNPTGKEKKCEIEILTLPATAVIKDYYLRKTIHTNKNVITKIAPFDAKVFICSKKNNQNKR